MDSKLGFSRTPWLGLVLLAMAGVGLVARFHAPATLPGAVEAAAAEAVIQPVLEAGAAVSPSPAQDGTHHRHTTLSMPYFSFARLLRPGS